MDITKQNRVSSLSLSFPFCVSRSLPVMLKTKHSHGNDMLLLSFLPPLLFLIFSLTAVRFLGRCRLVELVSAGRFGLRVGTVRDESVLHGACDADECFIDVDVVLGTAFPKLDTELLRELFTLLRGHDLLVEHVALVTHQDLVDVHVGMLLDLRYPIPDRLEAAAVGHVVDEQDALRAAEVRRGDGAEAFLPGSVPDLELDLGGVDVNVLDFEVDTDRRDERRRERIVSIPQQQAGLTDA